MSHADETDLKALLPLLRQLRDIKALREVRPGVFHWKSSAFVHFHKEDGTLFADLKKVGGSGFDRYRLDSAPGQRKLVDDAKLRVGRLEDD